MVQNPPTFFPASVRAAYYPPPPFLRRLSITPSPARSYHLNAQVTTTIKDHKHLSQSAQASGRLKSCKPHHQGLCTSMPNLAIITVLIIET